MNPGDSMDGNQSELTDRLLAILGTSPASVHAVSQSDTPSDRGASDWSGLEPGDREATTAAVTQINTSLIKLHSDLLRLSFEDEDSAMRAFINKQGAQRAVKFLAKWADCDRQTVTAMRGAREPVTAMREARWRVYCILYRLADGLYCGINETRDAFKQSLVESGVIQVASRDIVHVKAGYYTSWYDSLCVYCIFLLRECCKHPSESATSRILADIAHLDSPYRAALYWDIQDHLPVSVPVPCDIITDLVYLIQTCHYRELDMPSISLGFGFNPRKGHAIIDLPELSSMQLVMFRSHLTISELFQTLKKAVRTDEQAHALVASLEPHTRRLEKILLRGPQAQTEAVCELLEDLCGRQLANTDYIRDFLYNSGRSVREIVELDPDWWTRLEVSKLDWAGKHMSSVEESAQFARCLGLTDKRIIETVYRAALAEWVQQHTPGSNTQQQLTGALDIIPRKGITQHAGVDQSHARPLVSHPVTASSMQPALFTTPETANLHLLAQTADSDRPGTMHSTVLQQPDQEPGAPVQPHPPVLYPHTAPGVTSLHRGINTSDYGLISNIITPALHLGTVSPGLNETQTLNPPQGMPRFPVPRYPAQQLPQNQNEMDQTDPVDMSVSYLRLLESPNTMTTGRPPSGPTLSIPVTSCATVQAHNPNNAADDNDNYTQTSTAITSSCLPPCPSPTGIQEYQELTVSHMIPGQSISGRHGVYLAEYLWKTSARSYSPRHFMGTLGNGSEILLPQQQETYIPPYPDQIYHSPRDIQLQHHHEMDVPQEHETAGTERSSLGVRSVRVIQQTVQGESDQSSLPESAHHDQLLSQQEINQPTQEETVCASPLQEEVISESLQQDLYINTVARDNHSPGAQGEHADSCGFNLVKSSSVSTIVSAATSSSAPPKDGEPVRSTSEKIRGMSEKLVERWGKKPLQKFVNNVMSKVYDQKFLEMHCAMVGKNSKEAMPTSERDEIIALTLRQYPNDRRKDVIQAIRTKLNNAAKKKKVPTATLR